jgi:hypothetical protein
MLLDHYVVLATTKIDLNQAYHQIRVAEDSKKYTAMLTRWGGYGVELYELWAENPKSLFTSHDGHLQRLP